MLDQRVAENVLLLSLRKLLPKNSYSFINMV
jgi:hypothetical protein